MDVTEELARDAAARLGFEHYSNDWRALVNDPEIDIIVIVTTNNTHAEIAIAAAKAVKHIICEKPLALGAEQAKEMLEAVQAASVKHAVDVDDEFITMVKFDNGAIGTIEATRNAWGRNNFLTFEIHGEKGSLYFNYERLDELQVCFADDPSDAKGFRTVYTGPATPYGEGLWTIPALCMGYGETKIIETYDLFKAIVEDTSFHQTSRMTIKLN
ncbi:Gfo/Idh/MocA family protein [Neobacillus sp. B4I6]|uniref:Gfo/Idh/MocA family protein n=1 Tax=Neobacillus sp. B4I6 TaxID=3373925 RepID=UPI003D190A65